MDKSILDNVNVNVAWDLVEKFSHMPRWKPEDVKTQYFLAVRKGLVVYTPRQYEWIKFYCLFRTSRL